MTVRRDRRRVSGGLRVTLVCLGVMIPAACSLASVIHVPGDVGTIQGAINQALDGDSVLVADGHYHERLVLRGKEILLASHFALDGDTLHVLNTIIDGDSLAAGPPDSASVIRFINHETAACRVAGFTIQSGTGTVEGGTATYGGGIYCREASPVITRCLIRNNVVTANGGGLYCNRASHAQAIDCRFEANRATNGAGFCAVRASVATLVDCVLEENTATLSGGGGTTGDSAGVALEGCRFYHNSVTGGGGVGGGLFLSGFDDVVTDCRFVENSASAGAGIYFSSHSLQLQFCLFCRNTATGLSAGGGITCSGGGVHVNNCTFHENSAITRGGGIYAKVGGPVTVLNSILWHNTPVQIYVNSGSTATVSYSDVENGWPGVENIDCDPEFCDPEVCDDRLGEGSCCLGAGQGGVDLGAGDAGCGVSGVRIDDPPRRPQSPALLRISPNPATHRLDLEYALSRPARTRCELLDPAGRLRAVLFDGLRSAGEHRVGCELPELPSGVYVCRLVSDGGVSVRKLTLIR